MKVPHIMSVMTPFPHTIEISATLPEARRLMAEHHVRHLPVTEDGALVGVISDRDIKLALDPSLGLPPEEELCVEDICVLEAYIVGLEESLDNVLIHMAEHRIGSVLVVKEGRLAGIFTVTDVCRCFARFLRGGNPVNGNDAA
jgi:acetoin utilization protein AcuB